MRRLFPGDRAVWLVAGIVGAVVLAVLTSWLLRRDEHQLGSTTAPTTAALASITRGQEVCQDDTPVPDGTARVVLHVAGTRDAPVVVTVGRGAKVSAGRERLVGEGISDVAVTLQPTWHTSGDAALADVCVRSPVTVPLTLHGWPQTYPEDGPLRQNGETIGGHLSMVFLPRWGKTESLISLAPSIMRRAALFRPSPIGSWTYWVLLFVALPLAAYAGIRALATARGGKRALWLVATVAALNAITWAVITPAFNAPDEQAHFAYAEYLARTGQQPQHSGGRSPLSSQEANAIDGQKTFAFHVYSTKPPWSRLDEQRWSAATHGGSGLSTTDGGGVTTASSHGPLYYAVVGVPAYWLASADGTFSELLLIRLLTALLAAVVAICAVLTVGELLPGRPSLALGAGLLVAFEPTFSFMSGAVNNDGGVNALAAIAILLVVRSLRRGLTIRRALALGATAAALPVAKGTGYELYPVILLAVALLGIRAWRSDERANSLRTVGVLVGTLVAGIGLWHVMAPALSSSGFSTPGGASPVNVGTHSPQLFLSYLWQTFFPRLPFTHTDLVAPGWPAYDVYVKEALAVFGWTQFGFPDWVYRVALGVMACVTALGVAALVRHRAVLKRRLGEVAVVVLVPLSVVAGVAYAEASPTIRAVPFEQGRYLFPALVGLAALVAGACTAVSRRSSVLVMAGAVTAMMGLAGASFALALSHWYA